MVPSQDSMSYYSKEGETLFFLSDIVNGLYRSWSPRKRTGGAPEPDLISVSNETSLDVVEMRH